MGLSNSLSTAVRLPIREVLLHCSLIKLCSDLTPVLSAVYLADRTTSHSDKENQSGKTSHTKLETQFRQTGQRN
jgi:hypothetical protein